jgi:osmotically-inducible protein OsmY
MIRGNDSLLNLEREDSQSTDKLVCEQVRAALAGSSYHCIRRIQCSVRDGMLSLRGRVPSYYLKQMALTAVVKSLDYPTQINDQLDVAIRG